MSEFERWLAEVFLRRGPDLVIGPIPYATSINREQVDVLIMGLLDVRHRLPTLEQRLRGQSTCESCDGTGTVHDVDNATEADCPACDGDGFAPRKGEDL